MVAAKYLKILKQGIEPWNKWRIANEEIMPDLTQAKLYREMLRGANLGGADLSNADLREANLDGANLSESILSETRLSKASLFKAKLTKADLIQAVLFDVLLSKADLRGANLRGANLSESDLSGADLSGADLSGTILSEANLRNADFSGADLREADLRRTNLREANLNGADLSRAKLYRANLNRATLKDTKLTEADLYRVYLGRADLRGANLCKADLRLSVLMATKIDGTHLTGARVHGISVWALEGTPADQEDLIITWENEPVVTVDNLKMAQFVHLLLANEEIRDVIDTITSKVVLILGRFTADRKALLNALRYELRKRDFSPILFDFDIPKHRDITQTVTLLARMARFVIADLTDPRSIPQEIQAIAPDVTVPIQPVILDSQEPWSMFRDLRRKYHWVLKPYEYTDQQQLLAKLDEVLEPAEAKREELSTL